jgi:hypothetical protein
MIAQHVGEVNRFTLSPITHWVLHVDTEYPEGFPIPPNRTPLPTNVLTGYLESSSLRGAFQLVKGSREHISAAVYVRQRLHPSIAFVY